MIEYNYFGDEQKIYYEKMDNGLDIYVIPNNNISSYHVELVVKYGSYIEEFVPIGMKDYLKLPLGVAHFLEHKMFDMENEDVFSYYSKSGTYVNAGTSYFCTRYYIDGKKNLKKNLDYLLNMLFTPFLLEKNVESEKGIIEEEIKMYDDEPEWILDDEEKKCLFSTSIREKIAGTPETIKEITADILQKTYDTFYQPSNMFLVASGKIKACDIIDIVKNNEKLKLRKTNYPIIYKKSKELKKVVCEYKGLKANVIIPKLSYSFKFNLDDFAFLDYTMARLYLNIIFTYLFNDSSTFNEKVLEKKLAIVFYMDHLSFDNIYTVSIEAESEFADLFKDEVDKTIKKISFSEDDFLRIKKVWISILIRSLDNKEALAYSVIDDIIKGDKIEDQYELINKMNYQELLKVIEKLDFSNKSFILMIPKEK